MSRALVKALTAVDTRIQSKMSEQMKSKWNHPAGLKTIHFWAPAWKWALVIAGVSDYFRPPEKLSLNQSTSLALTGVLWSRYSMVVIPKNWVLFSVNVALGATGTLQVARILNYQQSLKDESN